MIEKVLEIFLVTYNRSACLERTLRQFKDCPLARCRFTVLDNCSTDDTPTVAASFQDLFPNYRIIRHNRNIGGDYNFLRAIELSTSLYTWILCDDDGFNFEKVAEVIAAVESCLYDLVYVASRSEGQLSWQRSGKTSVGQLVRDGARFHRAAAFWPALIFKTERFDKSCFINAPYLFPSLKFINKSIADDFSIFVCTSDLVIRSDGNPGEIPPLELYKEWVTNATCIADVKLRRYVIEQWTDRGFFKTLFFWIALDRADRREGYWKRLVDITFCLVPIQRLKFMCLLPVMLVPIPKPVLIAARKAVYQLTGQKDISKLPPIDAVVRE